MKSVNINGYEVIQWWDRYSRSWVTQILDCGKNEVESYYDGTRKDAAAALASAVLLAERVSREEDAVDMLL